MNIKSVVIPQELTTEFSHVLIRLLLYPLVTLFCLNEVAAAVSNIKKMWLIIKYSVLLLALEWLSDWLGVFIYINPYLFWSGVFWIGYLLLMLLIMQLFHKKFYKGYRQP